MSLISQHSRRLITTRDSSRCSAIRMWSKSWAIPFRNSFTFVSLSKSWRFKPSVNAFIFLSVLIISESFLCRYSSRCRNRCEAGSSSWMLKIWGIWNHIPKGLTWGRRINGNSITHSYSADWLLYKVAQGTPNTRSVTFGKRDIEHLAVVQSYSNLKSSLPFGFEND